MFVIYTYFGRVLKQFKIADNETHHRALEEARKYGIEQERLGVTNWLKLVN